MSLPKEYVTELNELNKEILQKQPVDVIQFCASFFTRKLEEQRKHQWALEPQARSLGISLFPVKQSGSISQADDQPLFKQPFGDNDPHTRTDEEDPTSSCLFKSDFAVGSSLGGPINSTVDPMAQEPFRRSSVTTSNIPLSFNAQRRTSVSAETLNPNGIHDDWQAPVIPKSADQLNRLQIAVAKNFLFSALDSDSLSTVIGALKEVKLPAGSEVIKQGDEGDYFYVLEDGTVRFIVNDTEVSSSGPGSSFGELALMYNSPRAATALAQTDVTLWALDRLTFRKILLAKTSKKRQLYESFLKEVPVLSRLSSYERSKLADALETESYKPGDVIIKEGEVGENFYLMETGTAKVSKQSEGIVTILKRGDYFGEVALLNDTPRQATVVADSAVDVATLDKRGFQRLLGPAVEVLKRQDPTKH